ncbi:MAG TPA: hypothetical protein P5096_02625 [Patescibacteria group bacterium]|nr:hypothetical protein [Patescibacteria group bacterium]
MIGNLNHNFKREQFPTNPEVQVLISEIKVLNRDISDKTTQYNAKIRSIFAGWNKDVVDFTESFGETEKELFDLERSIDESLDKAILDFIDDEGALAEIEQD